MHGIFISNPHAGLTDRQRDVLQLIMQGLSNKEIARTLNIAHGTVKIHVAALFGKLAVHRRAAVAVAAAQFFPKTAGREANHGGRLQAAPRWHPTDPHAPFSRGVTGPRGQKYQRSQHLTLDSAQRYPIAS
jgi:DNA-binding CsgD family transcriptional regulator